MSEVDKNALYGRYQQQEDKRARLAMKAAHKALDIPEDEMQVNANRYGIGPLAAVGIALAGALIPGALATFLLLRDRPVSVPTPPATTPAAAPADAEYEVRFFNAKGELIDVPRKPK